MKQPKVGVLTMFYGSHNYGGCLQAYALVKYLSLCNIQAEQINYKPSVRTGSRIRRILALKPNLIYERVVKKLSQYTNRGKADCEAFNPEYLRQRAEAFADFSGRYVPSSEKIYTYDDISASADKYDVFVVGSDQVWNEVTEDSPYMLNFVPQGKVRVSYAASLSQDELSKYAKHVFSKALPTFEAISVREKEAAELLHGVVDKPVIWVLDPTMLLSRGQWDEVCSPPVVEGEYIFCYFLGSDAKQRKVAVEFSKKHGIKTVTLPYLQGAYRDCDRDFGDMQLWNVSPSDFLSLVKNAAYVFTDSFHACVFSHIYERQFFAFSRKEGHTNSRMYSFMNLAETVSHFCDTEDKYGLSYIEDTENIDYSKQPAELTKMKDISVRFIEDNILRESNFM